MENDSLQSAIKADRRCAEATACAGMKDPVKEIQSFRGALQLISEGASREDQTPTDTADRMRSIARSALNANDTNVT